MFIERIGEISQIGWEIFSSFFDQKISTIFLSFTNDQWKSWISLMDFLQLDDYSKMEIGNHLRQTNTILCIDFLRTLSLPFASLSFPMEFYLRNDEWIWVPLAIIRWKMLSGSFQTHKRTKIVSQWKLAIRSLERYVVHWMIKKVEEIQPSRSATWRIRWRQRTRSKSIFLWLNFSSMHRDEKITPMSIDLFKNLSLLMEIDVQFHQDKRISFQQEERATDLLLN